MNRLMRRMARFGKRGHDVQKDMTEPGTPPDVQSVRAKSTGHGKKTADKWNQ
jgi:hypothetical protein